MSKDKTAANLRKGETGVVKAYEGRALANKLVTLGLLPESTITMVRKSPLGDACYLQLDHQKIALRMSEAAAIVLYN